MDNIGGRRFIEIPGGRHHELPPLFVRVSSPTEDMDDMVEMASTIVESEELITEKSGLALMGELERERRSMDMALNLVEQYVSFRKQWQWGQDILEWIRQCETTFGINADLVNILRPDVWPHASRCSFVTLLQDKAIDTRGLNSEQSVGFRLQYREPPPISYLSNQFLFYLNSPVATTAYSEWASRTPAPISCLPPERFSFQVCKM